MIVTMVRWIFKTVTGDFELDCCTTSQKRRCWGDVLKV